ncbi:MAG: amidohydrolase family protein [Candidatus Lokiarchaeia archaeon]
MANKIFPTMEDYEKKDDFFKIDVECHLVGHREYISYFPGVKQWWQGIAGVARPLTYPMSPEQLKLQVKEKPEELIEFLDKYGVDMACLIPESMMDTTGYACRWTSNGEISAVCEQYPDRLISIPNVGPIKMRGKHALWELEYLVTERNAKMIKFYPPEDTYMNDEAIYPFYEKLVELKVPVAIHTGFCWVPPGRSKYCDPMLLDDVATDFPELTIIAFHAGWPYPHVLNLCAAAHPNIYIGLNLLIPWAIVSPRRFAEILGEAYRYVGPDRIVWGTDCAGFEVQIWAAVEGFRDFQIPEDMQEEYGYPNLTEEDKAKIFGLNMARVLNIKPERRV